ncbi:hypothetical protein CCH79_00020593, partial [Gambusia affinis]
GDVVQLAGEGATTTGPNNQRLIGAPLPSHLQCVDMRVVGVSDIFPTFGLLFHAEAQNKDMCHGDDGGAVVYNGLVYGVISLGKPLYACQCPAAVMDVCEYLGWIKQTVGLK